LASEASGAVLKGPPRARGVEESNEMLLDGDEKFHKYQGEVFCNRALNMKRVLAVGFDMDYTLAQYIPETFELLAHRGAVDKLVNFMGYPEEIKALPDYDPNFFQRGLMIDKDRGNVIKMDRHSYVKVAYHGTKPLNKQERTDFYGKATQKDFSASQFAPIDTLFSLPDAFMYSQLVTFVDENKQRLPALKNKSYKQIYTDVRHAVDLCHRDGVIKDRVAQDPGRYIQSEPGLVAMLKRYRASGRKVLVAWLPCCLVANTPAGSAT
jgi:HAD superfamily 5'-nucleotidase-like hydrolase